jgi:hypothetical protein
MRGIRTRVLWGVLLIAGGVLFLLQNLGIVPQGLELFWALVFALAALLFLIAFFARAENWWAAIPGFAFLGLAGAVASDRFATPGAQWGGSFFLAMLGLGFFAVFLRQPRHWWAIIPGGSLVTTAVVAGLGEVGRDDLSGPVLFFGLGLTFAILALLPGPAGRRRWPLFPAISLLALALLTLAPGQRLASLAWPAILILVGIYLLVRRPRARVAPPAPTPQPVSEPEKPQDPPAATP